MIGNNAVVLGEPWWVPGGGENHPDIILSEQSIWVDGELVIKDGIADQPGPLAAAGEALVPAAPKVF